MKISYLFFSAVLCVFSLGLQSCSSSPSVGEQLLADGNVGSQALGKQWLSADKKITSGEKMVKKGRKSISDGQKMVRKGEAQIADGRKMKMQIESEGTRAGYIGVSQN